jgi:hypothetical protein
VVLQRSRAINPAMSCLPDSGWLRALDFKASTFGALVALSGLL